ncbi:ABC transporter substrate-binding protein [Pseudothauera rhizosphaerae]|nr:ABC transporter substrate-binding protein [Pseudothauera rhizosphaerae]
MRSLLLAVLLTLAALPSQARPFTDMAGRQIDIPAHPHRIFPAVTSVTVTLAALAPDLLVGLAFDLPEGAAGFLPPELARLPVVRVLESLDGERILATAPDLVVGWHGITQARAETVMARIGKPLLLVEGEVLARHPATFRLLGAALGRGERAEALARYLEDSQARLAAALAGLPDEARPRVYYAESPDGLTTQCSASTRLEVIRLAGGRPALECPGGGLSHSQQVDMETLLALDPDVILARDRRTAEQLAARPLWQKLRAVREGRLYASPTLPFNWFDRPPSFMRALGAQWLARLLHPTRFHTPIHVEARRFNELFFGVTPPEDALHRMLAP